MDDKSIVDLYWARSERALDETRAKYGGYCLTIAYNILENSEDAEECVNDTYLRAWNSMPEHRPEKLSGYLGRITRNLSLNAREKRSAQRRGGNTYDAALDELAECIPSPDTTESCSDSRMISEVISRHLLTLPEEQRRIFVRRYWYFDPISDIAKRYRISESKVTSVLYRVRKSLRAQLQKEGVAL